MRPCAAANQLTRVLRAALPEEQWLPVDPLALAKELHVQVFSEDLGVGMEGAMLCGGGKTAIVISSRIREPGRRNFTAAHELGHYSLHKDREELRCSIENLLDVAPHPANIEQEANEFAMTLLMPADDVRAQMHDAPASIALVKRLATRYSTSMTATALRIRELSGRAFALCFVQAGKIKWWWPTNRFQWRPPKNRIWPTDLAYGDDPTSCSTEEHFGAEARARVGVTLRVSGADMPSYDSSLWVLETADARKKWEWDADGAAEG